MAKPFCTSSLFSLGALGCSCGCLLSPMCAQQCCAGCAVVLFALILRWHSVSFLPFVDFCFVSMRGRTGPPDMAKGVHWNIFQNICAHLPCCPLPSSVYCAASFRRCDCMPPAESVLLGVCTPGNTNYVLWYPYDEADRHTRSRFQMQFD